jgi:hypothetical protein
MTALTGYPITSRTEVPTVEIEKQNRFCLAFGDDEWLETR